MKDILQEIVANKRLEVAEQKKTVPLHTLLRMGSERLESATRPMRAALAASPTGIIAEFKRKSPSKGWLFPDAAIETVIPGYEKAGACACSVLTDNRYFGGSLNDLRQARGQTAIPLLRKDFMLDEYQLLQARIMGADAVLLIAAALREDECRALAETAHSLNLEVLLEIHHASELSYLNPFIDMLGVNNRNLGSFHTDVENSFRLAGAIKEAMAATGYAPLMVSESGISDADTIKRLRREGFQGFLIGESFMRTQGPRERLRQLMEDLV